MLFGLWYLQILVPDGCTEELENKYLFITQYHILSAVLIPFLQTNFHFNHTNNNELKLYLCMYIIICVYVCICMYVCMYALYIPYSAYISRVFNFCEFREFGIICEIISAKMLTLRS